VETYAGRRFKLSPSKAAVRVDVDSMVKQALAASHRGDIFTRAARALTGGSVHAHIPIAVTYSRPAVAQLVRRVQRKVNRTPVDATIGFSGGGVQKIDSRTGRAVDTQALTSEVGAELIQPTADHRVRAPVQITKPKVTTRQLAQRYPRVITIDRSAFHLTLYVNLKPAKTYLIAVGMQGLETPAGRYNIQDKEVNPSWHVPNSAWAGKLAGQTIPPGPQDPIKARWMGIANGAGIHGTAETGSLGTAGSHGCIRMAIPDVIELFDRVSLGDPVFIA
jgi:lipoprotein-anchoring transpeptidase ErfK/SrfK